VDQSAESVTAVELVRRDICIDCGRVLDPAVDDDVLIEQTWWESTIRRNGWG
jgi:hypothetical protein